MSFLEKDLEDYLWNEPVASHFDGLGVFLGFACDDPIRRFRQLQLGPYGIADLVQIWYTSSRLVTVQVIECKRHTITLSAYAQAKRYLTAAQQALADFVTDLSQQGIRVEWQCVLIGDAVERSGDFVFVLNDDPTCLAYTYTLEEGRILFSKVGKSWQYQRAFEASAFASFRDKAMSFLPTVQTMQDDALIESIETYRMQEGYGE